MTVGRELALWVENAANGRKSELHLLAEGHERRFPIEPAGDKSAIRFAVGEPGRRSTIWRLWAPPNKDDVYLASRRTADIFKVSLHESGDYRMQWSTLDRKNPNVVTHENSAGSRIMAQWQRQPPSMSGWQEALGLWVPTADVVEVPRDSEKYLDVQWLPAAPIGGVVQFRILIIEPMSAVYDISKLLESGVFSFINGFRLAGGRVLLLVAVTGPLTRSQAQRLRMIRAHAKRSLPASFDRSPAMGPHSLLIDAEPDGLRMLWDLAERYPAGRPSAKFADDPSPGDQPVGGGVAARLGHADGRRRVTVGRIGSASRHQFHKLTDVATLRSMRPDTGEAEQPPTNLVVNTDTSTPERSAKVIIEHFGLAPQLPMARYG